MQIKSKQRVKDHGEVFTREREVDAMLDLVKNETERIESRFLEPACGNGNFLAPIFEKKLGESIKIDITYLRNFIQEYRNDIVHFDKKIENIGMAKSKVFVIYERINSVTGKLLEASLIK